MQPLDFGCHPLRLFLECREFHHTNPVAVRIFSGQVFRRQQRRLLVVRNHLAGHAQNPRRRPVILRKRNDRLRRLRQRAPRSAESFQKNREAAERRTAKPVNGLVVVPHRQNIPAIRRQQPQQFQLRDIRILEFVHQNVAVLRTQPPQQFSVRLQQMHCLQQLRAERVQVPLPQQPLAHAIDPRQLLLLRHFFFRNHELVRLQRFLALLVFRAQILHVVLVIVRRNQLVLASRKKCLKILQEFRRLRQPLEQHQPQIRNIPPQQNPVIDIIERLNFRIRRLQDFLQAKRVKRRQPHALGPLASRLHHAVLHLSSSLVGEGKPQNIFTAERRIRIQQRPNPLGNHPRLAGPGPGNNQQRPGPMLDSLSLFRIQRKSGFRGGGRNIFLSHVGIPEL